MRILEEIFSKLYKFLFVSPFDMSTPAVPVLKLSGTTWALKAGVLATLVLVMPLEIAGTSIIAPADVTLKTCAVTFSLPGSRLRLPLGRGCGIRGSLSIQQCLQSEVLSVSVHDCAGSTKSVPQRCEMVDLLTG